MTARTLKALRASIAHHKRNLKAKTPGLVRLRRKNCALCGLFNRLHQDTFECKGCPVMEKTGYRFCCGTPFHEASKAHFKWRAKEGTRAAFLQAERAEIAFLESLLPEGKE